MRTDHPKLGSTGIGSTRIEACVDCAHECSRPLARGVLAVIAAFIALSPHSAKAIPVTVDLLASTEVEIAALPNIDFDRFANVDEDDGGGGIAVDADGGILFQAEGNELVTFKQFSGILSVAPGSKQPTPFVTSEQTAPDGGTFRSIENFIVNESKSVVFFGRTSLEGDGLFARNGAGDVSLVVSETDISIDTIVGVTAAGDVFFTGEAAPDFNTGLFKRPIAGGEIVTIAIDEQAIPGFPNSTMDQPFDFQVNADGDVTYLASGRLDPVDRSSRFSDGVFHVQDGVTEFLGFNGGPPPNPEDGTSWRPESAFVAPSGDIVVSAGFETADGGRFSGIWFGSGVDDLQLVKQGQEGNTTNVAFGPDERFFFTLGLDGAETLLVFDPGNIEVEGLLDSDTETEFGRLSDYTPLGATEDGTAVFFARSDDGNEGYYALEADGVLTSLVRAGDEIEGNTIFGFRNPDDDGQAAFNGRTLAVLEDTADFGQGELILRVTLGGENPTDFVFTGACGSDNWHDLSCEATNWIGPAGEPVTEPPGDAPVGDENATIVDAKVRIADRAVTLNSLTATGELQLDNTLNLGGTPPIVAFGPERQDDIPPGGLSTIANIRINEIGGGLLSSGETTLTGEGFWGGKIATQDEGVVINDGTLNIVRFSGAAVLDGVFSNRGTVNQTVDLEITGRTENQGIWRIESGDLTEPTSDGGSFVNDGTLINATVGDTTVALNYAGGNNSKIEGSFGNLILTDGGAFAGETTIELGDGATAQLDGAGPNLSVFTVTGATDPVTQQTIFGVLTVQDTGDAGGKLIVGLNGALDVAQGSRLAIAGSNLELKGGELTGQVEIKKSPGPNNFFSDQGQFNFLAGRLGTADAAADLLVDTGGFLTIGGEEAANRSLFGNIEVKSSAFQSTDLQIEGGAITVAEGGEWRITSGSLTEPTPGNGTLINNGTLGKFLAGDARIAVSYEGGNGSKIEAQIEGDAGELFLIGGGAFAGETTIQNGVRATVRLDGAGPDKTVFSVVSAIDPEAVAVVRGVLTVRGVDGPGEDGDEGQFIVGPNAALNVEQNSRLVVSGTRLVLNGGDLTGKVEIETLPPSGDDFILFGEFGFESGRLGIAGSRADLSVQLLTRLEIAGAPAADRSLVGDVEVDAFGKVVQRTDLRVDNSTITIASLGGWKVEGGSLLSDAASTLTIQGATEPDEDGDVFLGGTFQLSGLEPSGNTVSSFAGVLDNRGIVSVTDGTLNFTGKANQLVPNVFLGANELAAGTWIVRGENAKLRFGTEEEDLLIRIIGANASVILEEGGQFQNFIQFPTPNRAISVLSHNAGSFKLSDTEITTLGDVTNTGTFEIFRSVGREDITATIGGRFINNDGDLNISRGARLVTTEYITNAASDTRINGRLEVTNVENVISGKLSGLGTISSLGVIRSVQAVIAGGNSPGTLTFDTPLFIADADTVFNIEVGGTEAGTEFDLLMFTGDVVLAGMLVFDFIDGFLPDTADLFKFFEVAGQLSGQFDQITVNGLGDEVDFDVIIDPVTGEIILADVIAANIGVPEPSTLGLLVVGLFGLGWAQRRRRAA